MVRKKMIALLLSLAVSGTLLVGCGEDAKEPIKENTQEQNTQTDNTQTESMAGEVDTTEANAEVEPPAPEYPELTTEEEIRKFSSVIAVGDSAYELYTYVDSVAEDYALAVNHVAATLEGQSDVYNIVIPLGSGIVFPDNLKEQLDSSDQREAMEKIRQKMDEKVKAVDIYDTLMTHRNEYIYFRTDHHWTGLGAYYAYEQFCREKGIEPEALDSYETMTFDGFLGSFYLNDTQKDARLGANPDVVTAYLPNSNAIMHVTGSNGVEFDSKVIYDETKAAAGLKYSCFIAGDNPYTEIVNSDLTDGSSCIVVKESFGNAFVPFLVDHYQTIYVVDYRYWTGSVTELAAQKNVNDVIFVNNLSMIRNKNLVGKLYRVV